MLKSYLLKNCSQNSPLWNIIKVANFKIFLNKCSIHTSSLDLFLFESDPKGKYAQYRPKVSVKEQSRVGLKLVKEEIENWQNEVREAWHGDIFLQGIPGVVDKVFEFKTEEDHSRWIVTSDRDNNEGDSSCQLNINENGKGVFTGNLNLELPKDGEIRKAGYCNMRTVRHKRSFQRDSHFNWGMYTHLVMRVRGDGRTYVLNLSTSGYFDITWNDAYTFALFTRGGPYWQYTRIPFSRFFFTSKGMIQDRQCAIPLTRVSSFGITLAERVPGPFCLEIDYIGLEYDPDHTEEFAYEMYKLPEGLAST